MGDKSPGIRTPLKETNIVPNYCCRICRIYVKISGRSKINVLGYDNKDFSQTLSSVLSADVHDSTGFQGKQLKRRILSRGPLVLVICFFMVARKPEKLLLIKISPVVSWLQRFVSKINMYSDNLARILVWRLHFLFCGTTALGRVMQQNKPLRFEMYFQRFLLTQCQK